MDIIDIIKIVDSVDGWLSYNEGKLLYYLAKERKGTIVEIGSWMGKSTIWMGFGSHDGHKAIIYSIDPHNQAPEYGIDGIESTYPKFIENIERAGVDDVCVFLVKTSEEAVKQFADDSVDLIFIDGSHEFDYVNLDYQCWFPKLKQGGVMAFHDSKEPDVRRVVEAGVYKSKYFKNVKTVDSITYAEKVKKHSLADFLKKRHFLLYRNLAEWSKKVGIPQPIRILGKKILWRKEK